jgi:Stress responsive A/B Barrel Domain
VIKHIVFFKFKTEVPEADRGAFLESLRAMKAQIPELAELQAGRDVLRQERSFDVALVTAFADLPALARYAKHEAHAPVIQRSREICSEVVVVDYEY